MQFSKWTSLRLSIMVASVMITVTAALAQDKPVPPSPPFGQVIPFAAQLYHEQARALLKAGKPDEAIAKWRRAIQEFPDFIQARIDLAQELLGRRELKEATELIEGARRVNDRDARVYRLFGLIMREEGKFKMAEFAFRQSIERNPNFAPNYQAHGVTLVDIAMSPDTTPEARANWLTQAEQQLLKSLTMSEGKLAFSHLHLARVYETRGEKLKAAQELESFLLKNPRAANEKSVRAVIEKLRQ